MKKVLLIEDNPRLRKGIKSLLEKKRFIIIEFHDFEKELELSQINEWLNASDAAIISLEIPEGWRSLLISALKSYTRRKILLFFTTSKDDLEIIKNSNGLNGFEVVEKQFGFKGVIERIETYLKK
jgi:DNA-binding response OmpR family regulator